MAHFLIAGLLYTKKILPEAKQKKKQEKSVKYAKAITLMYFGRIRFALKNTHIPGIYGAIRMCKLIFKKALIGLVWQWCSKSSTDAQISPIATGWQLPLQSVLNINEIFAGALLKGF